VTGIGLAHYLGVAAILFTIGVFGIFVNRKNVIIILMSIELILLAVNINLVAFSAFLHEVTGQIFAMIGAIVLTLHHKQNIRRQNIAGQVARSKSSAIEIVKVKSGQGLP